MKKKLYGLKINEIKYGKQFKIKSTKISNSKM